MQNFSTPMMKQYMEIKKNYQDCLLFYRMGDFYELFMEDAHIGARILNITLTSKHNGKNGKIPMAGVPYHAVDAYLNKLVKAGYKVAICEQVSLPNKYGLVDREVVRVVTPGTMLDEKALEKKENNYIISLLIEDEILALAIADISTGYFSLTQLPFENLSQVLRDELSRINPSECILPESLYNDPELLKLLKTEKGLSIYCFHEWDVFAQKAEAYLKKHFGVATLAGFAVEDKLLALQAAASLLGYLEETQKTAVSHIKKITIFSSDEYMMLDKSTMINLELFSTIREHDTRGTLLNVLDMTKTAMGGRLLKQWLRKPLLQKSEIGKRHDAVEEFLKNNTARNLLRTRLEEVNDIERILSRLSVHIGNARDIINLKQSLHTILDIKASLKEYEASLIQELTEKISQKIKNTIEYIDIYIIDEPPIDLKSGGLIKNGVDKELDTLRHTVSGSKNWIAKLEEDEKERTGISSLKIRFNKVFGFYIEISRSNLHLVPQDYIRKQTLVNGERFITPELKQHEEIILTAEEKINELEYSIFIKVLAQILTQIEMLQEAAQSIAILDCLLNFANLAETEEYVRPKMLYSGEIRIKNGRHPVVEKLLDEMQFVPNDITLDNINQQLLLITGPNMAGKSVLIRQVALIVLMAQIGCFVPAEQAYISIVDRIFVRSGASDVITSGLSTFMVEMVETAYILHHTTRNSLIIMDEIGRGTSTYDGISIAWAVAEHLVTAINPSPKTLFATHYHELQALEEQYPTKIKNYHMAVANEKGVPVFLYTILPGGASHSFGVAVAKLAGIPFPVIEKALEVLSSLENRQTNQEQKVALSYQEQLPLTQHLIHKELEQIDIHQMTPLEALNKLAELKDKIKLLQKKDSDFIGAD